MNRPRLLDLFAGAGGAAMGYHRAGFEVVGVDIKPQPRYPFEFIQGDAIMLLDDLLNGWPTSGFAAGYILDNFDAIHASPPCQDHSELRGPQHGTGWMLAATLDRLSASGRPYVVENVPGARGQMPGAYLLCGKSMGLAPLKRHRLFASNVPMVVPPCSCNHLRDKVIGVYGDLRAADRNARRDRPSRRASVDTARRLLDCPWMDGPELSQAIPPAYTEFIGGYLMAAVREAVAS